MKCSVTLADTPSRTSPSAEACSHAGKRILTEGWREIDRIFRSFLKEKQADEDSGGDLPAFTEGQTFEDVEAVITEHFTSAPKPYTDVIFCERKEWIGIEERSSA